MREMINNGAEAQSNYRSAGSNLMYLLIGGGIGATIGLLFAPKPGRELRQDVSEGVKYGLETANEKVSVLREVAGEKVSALRETADNYYQKAQDKVSEFYQGGMKSVNDGTEEAKNLVNQSLNQANDTLDQASNTINSSQAENEPPLFDAGGKPFDERNIKNGIL
jgi:gas vesicle protein